MLGVVFLQQGDVEAAERQIRRAIQINTAQPEAYNNLGSALRLLKRYDDALVSLNRAIALQPNYAEAYGNRANVLRLLGRLEEALDDYDHAIALKPAAADIFYNRGGVLEDLQRWDDAVASYENAIALKPDFPQACNNLGNALMDVCRYEEALMAYDRVLALRPAYVEAMSNRGNALRHLRRYDEALETYARAITRKPDFAEAHNGRGSTYRSLGRFDDALADYRRVLSIEPEHVEARWNIALTRLLRGEWSEGWKDYDLRFRKRHNRARRPDHPAPEWIGEPLSGKSILVSAEQGYGDTIQFIRFVPRLVAQGARVTVVASQRLHRLLSTIGKGITFVDSLPPGAQYDYQIPLMSLPRVFDLRTDTVPAEPYLEADHARSEIWRVRLGNGRFKVGLCWQGNPAGSIDNGRSVPLAEFLPLTQVENLRVISLQRIHGLDQLNKRPRAMAIETPEHDFDCGADAFLDTAAMMQHLDLVVTTDTSVAHLAGALGRPVWVALQYVPDWRWLLDRSDTPWYRSMRLFRQKRVGDWSDPIAEMTAALRRMVDGVADDLNSVA